MFELAPETLEMIRLEDIISILSQNLKEAVLRAETAEGALAEKHEHLSVVEMVMQDQNDRNRETLKTLMKVLMEPSRGDRWHAVSHETVIEELKALLVDRNDWRETSAKQAKRIGELDSKLKRYDNIVDNGCNQEQLLREEITKLTAEKRKLIALSREKTYTADALRVYGDYLSDQRKKRKKGE
jgi:hypothetical protein